MTKTILISGANGNLGTSITKVLYEQGHKICATVGKRPLSVDFKKQVQDAQQINLLDETATQEYIEMLTKRQPQLNTALLLVGGFAKGDIRHTSIAEIDTQIALNFKTAWFLVQPLITYFEKNGGGQFIFIGSKPAIDPATAKNEVAYALAKSLLFRLAEIINETGKDKGITATIIVPGTLDTPTNRKAISNADFSKWVKPADVGKTVAFLLSEPAQALRETVLKVYN